MGPTMTGFPTDAITWTALLGQWMDFARTSVALPSNADGHRWRQSVSPIITLQAVTFALGEIARVDAAEQALARDKADILIRRSAQDLEAAPGRIEWSRKPEDRRSERWKPPTS